MKREVEFDAVDQKVAGPVIFKANDLGCIGAHRKLSWM
jgi:hypothetical protein